MDYIVIVASGKGKRINLDEPKQFLPIAGKPILMWTIQRIYNLMPQLQIIVVLPKEYVETWENLCKKYMFSVEHTITEGGDTRFQSVKNGLDCIEDNEEGIVGIHDGVRPFVTLGLLKLCYDEARKNRAVIPVMPLVNSIREIKDNGESNNVDRANYRIVQTPQTFDIQLIKRAYNQTYKKEFTDDATVVEALGEKVTMVEGASENLKITYPTDLLYAQTILNLPHRAF